MKFIFFILFFSFLDNLFSENILNNIYQINKETKVSFTIPIDQFEIAEKVTDETSINELDDLRFVKYENFSGFQPYKYYIKKIKINNLNESPITLSVIHPFTHIKSEFYVTSKSLNESFSNTASSNFNTTSSINPLSTNFENIKLRNFSFTIKPNEVMKDGEARKLL